MLYSNNYDDRFVSWDIFLDGKLIDTVMFDNSYYRDDVLYSLINESIPKFDSRIEVKLSQPFKNNKQKNQHLGSDRGFIVL